MIEGKTSSGFEFSVQENVRDNMELIDALADLEDGNTVALSKIGLLVLGKDQRKKLYDHLRRDDGTVPIIDVSNELVEIVNSLGKNSSPSPA